MGFINEELAAYVSVNGVDQLDGIAEVMIFEAVEEQLFGMSLSKADWEEVRAVIKQKIKNFNRN